MRVENYKVFNFGCQVINVNQNLSRDISTQRFSLAFSLFILWFGMVAINLSYKGAYKIYQMIDYFWLFGGLAATILFHSYVGYRVCLHLNN